MHNIFEQLFSSITKNADSNCFYIDEVYYTYFQFEKKIAGIQNKLKRIHNGSKNIGLVTNNDLETYASILAIWFSGYSYVPISPRTPIKRNSEIIEQANIQLILSSKKGVEKFIDCGNLEIIDTAVQASNDFEIAIVKTLPEDFLYILFTSGSTGIPKGVPISKKNVEAFIGSFWALNYKHEKDARFLQMFELTFDVSVASFLVPLLTGACIYTVPSDVVKYTYIYSLLDKHKITFATLVPSVLAYLKPYFDEILLPDLRYCILTAEASSNKMVKEWEKCIPNAEIWNLYGPTEATIWCIAYQWKKKQKNEQYNGFTPIGKPLKMVDALIVDEKSEPVAKGLKGELLIAGDQITNGYLSNNKKNKEAFIIKKGQRFYKTGDSCFINNDGDIMYCGRIDNQVQIQGFRVELGEIENHTREFTKLDNVAAIAYENQFGNTEVHLFVENYQNDIKLIAKYLKTKLPEYMIPKGMSSLQVFPQNASNKIDRVALKKMIKK